MILSVAQIRSLERVADAAKNLEVDLFPRNKTGTGWWKVRWEDEGGRWWHQRLWPNGSMTNCE